VRNVPAVTILFALFPAIAAVAGPAFDPATGIWRSVDSVHALDGSTTEAAQARAVWQFGPNVAVHPADGSQHLWPDIVALPATGVLCAAWMDDHTGAYKIYSAASADAGATWGSVSRVDDSAGSAMARFVSLAPLADGTLAAVWEDVRAGGWNWNVYFARGTWDPGQTRFLWSAAVRVNTTGGSTDAGSYMHPSIAAGPGGRVCVAWTDWREGIFFQVYSRTSTDNGATWGTEVRISDEIGYQPVAGDPCLLLDPLAGGGGGAGDLLCVWNDWRGNVPGGRYPEVYFSRSTDGGATWMVPNVHVNDVVNYYQQVAKRVVAVTLSGRIAVGWYNDDLAGPAELRMSISTDRGATWGTSTTVNDPSTGAGVPVHLIGGQGNDILAAWMGYAGNWNAYFRSSGDAGTTWGGVVRLDDDATGAATYNPIIAVLPAGSPVALLQDTRPGTGAYNIWAASGVRDPSDAAAVSGEAPASLRVTPNPSRGGFVRLDCAFDPGPGARLRVIAPDGREVLRQSFVGTGPFLLPSPAGSGQYWLLVEGGKIRAATRVTVLE
jgi:hypothetical protein